MPLMYVQRFGQVVLLTGTQTVTGTLEFNGPTEVELDPSVFNATGIYVLFSYGSFDNADMVNLTVDATGCRDASTGNPLTAGTPVNDSANSRITVTLS